jgi:hypothetical protein
VLKIIPTEKFIILDTVKSLKNKNFTQIYQAFENEI